MAADRSPRTARSSTFISSTGDWSAATKTIEDGRVVEIAAIGIEGIAEFVALLGMDRSHS